MNSINNNQTQLRTLFFGLLCVIAGVMCFAQGFSHGSVSPAVSQSAGERLGDSASSVHVRDAGTPQFASITPRYVTKRIADIEIGEDVVSRDPQSGEITTRRVLNSFHRVSDHLRILTVVNPVTKETQTIETTNEHPFWVGRRGDWIKAKDLDAGDQFDNSDGSHSILVETRVEFHPTGIDVYNFEVEEFHNYYVRAHGSRGPPILTHNADCGGETLVFGLRDELSILKSNLPGALDYKAFYDKGLSSVNLKQTDNADEFLFGVREAISNKRVSRIAISLDGIDLSDVSYQFGRGPELTTPHLGIRGNITSHELKAVFEQYGILRQRGVDLQFIRNGTTYEHFFDAIKDTTGKLRGQDLDTFYNAMRF